MKTVLWLFFCVLAGLYIAGPIADPDLWWHIVAGRWIITNSEIPYRDYWNMFGISMPWRAYSWSNEILFAFIDQQWGIEGLLALQCLFALLISLTFAYVFGKLSNDNFFGGLLGFYSTIATFNHFSLRPQSLTWIFFAWLIYVADQIKREGINSKRLLCLSIIIILWANTHLTTLLGIGSVLLWIYDSKKVKEQGVKYIWHVALVLVGSLFITPYLGGEIFALFSHASHPFAYSSISEFQPAQINSYSTVFLIILLAVFLLFLHKVPKIIPLSQLVLLVGFTIAALAVIKFLPLAIIIISALLASIWRVHGDKKSASLGELGISFSKLKKLYFSTLEGQGLAVLLLAAIFIQVVRIQKNPISLDQTPKEALDYIMDHKLSGPILNLFGDGGYVMYRFSDESGNPSLLVPIDGRTNVNSPEIMRMHSAALRGQLNWKEYLDAVKPNTILWRVESPLTALLLESPDWCLVHKDGSQEKGHVVFSKKIDSSQRCPITS